MHGTLHYVNGFDQYSKGAEGNFLAIDVDAPKSTEVTIKTTENPTGKKATVDDTGLQIVWKVDTSDETLEVSYDDKSETYKASGLELELPSGANALTIPDQTFSFGNCGLVSTMISPETTIDWDGIHGHVKGKLFKYDKDSMGHTFPFVLGTWAENKQITVESVTQQTRYWHHKVDSTSTICRIKDGDRVVAILDFRNADLSSETNPASS